MKMTVVAGWLVAVYAHLRYLRLERRSQAALAEAAQTLLEARLQIAQAQEALADVYRIKLSCPLCDWTYIVVRENRDLALAAGNLYITDHNAAEGHLLTGEPRSGYFRGEPIN